MSKPRYSKQSEQEAISRAQLDELLSNFGWVVNAIARDVGEDFVVQIYDDGISSGITFYVQLKSVEKYTRYRLKSGLISYPVEVEDLQHWYSSAVPVIFIVWNVKAKEGYWIEVKEAVNQLNKRNPDWQGKNKVQVHITPENRIDEMGLNEIRQRLAVHYSTIFFKDRPFEFGVEFVFDDTPEGKNKLEALERSFTAGDPFETSGKFINKLIFPDWHNRLFGEVEVTDDSLLMLGPSLSKSSIPLRLDVVSEEGIVASVAYAEFRTLRQGTEQFTISNEHQTIPLHFEIVVNHVTGNGNVTIIGDKPGASVQDTREAIAFLETLLNKGKLRITNLSTTRSGIINLPTQIDKTAFDPRFVELVDKLCFIQDTLNIRLMLKEWTINNKDIIAIEEIYLVLTSGRHDLLLKGASITIGRDGLEVIFNTFKSEGEQVRLSGFTPLQPEDADKELLGQRIVLGPATLYLAGIPTISTDDLEAIIPEMGPEEFQEVNLVEVSGYVEYPEWLPAETSIDAE
jgi:hypothetical protein